MTDSPLTGGVVEGADEAHDAPAMRIDPGALRAFKREVRGWARKMDVQPLSITVRPMTTKWGSCSTSGRLTFDSSVLTMPPDERSEVVVHELLHLKVPNHGKLFTSLMRAYLSPLPRAAGS